MSLLSPESASKTQLGMGELFSILQVGTHVEPADESWAFLEVQDGTEITELEFTYDRNNVTVVVTKFNNIVIDGVVLIPSVYKQQSGRWTKITIASGQINCYGKNPIG